MSPKSKENVLNRGAACLECRKRKLKCDAIKPHCTACVKSGRQARCIYEAIRNKNLADQLEDRVNQLERMVDRMEREGPPAPPAASYPASSVTQPMSTGTFAPPSHLGHRVCPGTRPELGSGLQFADMPLTRWHSTVAGWSRLPQESHDFMIDTFTTYLPKSYLQLHYDRFLQTLALRDSDPRSLHPAMMSAIYLLACYHWSDSLSSYEETFLAQARNAMAESLSKTDRLLTGFIQPGILVAEYLLNRGRFREAYHQIIQIARFSVDCNLHKITTSIWRPGMSTGPGKILPAPADAIELGERILSFWAVFMLDQRCCLIMGFPSSFSKGDDLDTRARIDTVWPASMYDYEEGNVTDTEFMTLRFLCTDRPPFALHESDYGFRIRLQSFALYRFAGDVEMPSADIDMAIEQFLKRLPVPDMTDTINTPSIVVAHVVARAATIRLCARTSAAQTMDDRALQASLGCAQMAHMITMSDYDMWALDLVLSYIWADCAKIVGRHIQSRGQSSSSSLRPALSAFLAGISKAALVYPVLVAEVRMVETLVSSLN